MKGNEGAMTSAGDKILDNILNDAEQKLEHPAATSVCPEHEPIRLGMYALILDLKDRRANGGGSSELKLFGGKLLSVKGVNISGREITLITLIIGMLALWADKILAFLK